MMDLVKGDYAVTIQRAFVDQDDAVVNISTATTLSFLLQQPDGTVLTRTATFLTDGSDGIVVYSLVSSDLSQVGAYQFQFKVAGASFQFSSIAEKVSVRTLLA